MQPSIHEHAAHVAVVPAMSHGLVAGTILMTLDGEIPVEHLTPGDRIITRDAGMARLVRISFKRVSLNTVRIARGCLGNNRPDRDMYVSANTPIHVRDWRAESMFGTPTATVSAIQLTDGEFVTDEGLHEVAMFELEFDAPHILYADGVEVRSEPLAAA